MARFDRFGLGVLAVWVLALAGCAGPEAPPAGTQFDGSYVGTDALLNGVDFQCGATSLPVQIQVHDGRFVYPFQVSPPRTAPLPAQVTADGSAEGHLMYEVTEDFPLPPRSRPDWAILNGR